MTSETAAPSSLPLTPSKPESRLKEPKRVDYICTHRKFQCATFALKHRSQISINAAPSRPHPPTPRSLDGLQSILLSELGSTAEKVWAGRVISLTVISAALITTPSIHLVVEDDEGSVERLSISDFPSAEEDDLIHKRFAVGCKLSVINPYFRIANDGNTNIRVDDFKSVVCHPMSEDDKKVCFFCLQTPATKLCTVCRSATYCSKNCQRLDWTLYEHKRMCKLTAKSS